VQAVRQPTAQTASSARKFAIPPKYNRIVDLHRASLRFIVFVCLAAVLALLLPVSTAASAPPPPEPRVRQPTRTPAPARKPTRRPLPASVRVPILMYHYISDLPPEAERLRRELTVTPDVFESHLMYLRDNGYTAVTLDAVYDYLSGGAPLPPNPVVLTFDDGHLDAYTEAFPRLKKYGMTGTFFIVTDFINYKNPAHVTWDMVREMHAAGMRIESHGRTHIDLRNRSNAVLVWELLGPVEQIEAYVGRRPRFFCYPAGRYDARVISILTDLRMLAAVTTESGVEHRLSSAMTWRRVRVNHNPTLAQFATLVDTGP
jgi:peptidoglycan/xylan/chitin deacetylase (PgdA/CDA1 family)